MTQQNTPPIKSFSAAIPSGRVQASIWENISQEGDRKVTRYSISLRKRYCDDKGVWKNTDYFFANDLPRLQLVAQKAFEFVALKESTEEDKIPV